MFEKFSMQQNKKWVKTSIYILVNIFMFQFLSYILNHIFANHKIKKYNSIFKTRAKFLKRLFEQKSNMSSLLLRVKTIWEKKNQFVSVYWALSQNSRKYFGIENHDSGLKIQSESCQSILLLCVTGCEKEVLKSFRTLKNCI